LRNRLDISLLPFADGEAFIDAAQKGDMAGLEGLFAEGVVSYSDGGAARFRVSGRTRVATFRAAASHFWKGVTLAWVETNGKAAVLILREGVSVSLTTVDALVQGIDETMWMMRPSKLVRGKCRRAETMV
jgi:RNA polymerase sigma-70 factor (ECF subfamily)